MGVEHKKNVGTYMGEQEMRKRETPASGNGVGAASFKRGAILPGLPGQNDMSPKAGYPAPPKFQEMKDSDPAKDSI